MTRQIFIYFLLHVGQATGVDETVASVHISFERPQLPLLSGIQALISDSIISNSSQSDRYWILYVRRTCSVFWSFGNKTHKE